MKKMVALTVFVIAAAVCDAATIVESSREIPVVYDVDVVVVGGSIRAAAAALTAKQNGASVFLAAERPYLGDDLCATWRLWLDKGEEAVDELGKAIFDDDGAATPMNVKRQLDDALIKADIPFLFGCYVTDILQDGNNRPAGIVMANRSGRQAVIARVIIDATDRGIAARLAGANFRAYPKGKQSFKRIVVGGESSGKARLLDAKVPQNSTKNPQASVYEYTVDVDMKDGSWASFARADRVVRDQTWQDKQIAASEQLFQVPPDPVHGRKHQADALSGADGIDLDSLRPKDIDRMYVLSGSADLSSENAAMILRPLNGIALGRRVGTAAAKEAKKIITKPGVLNISLRGASLKSPGDLVVGEMLQGLRSRKPLVKQFDTILSPSRQLPVLAEVDVVVVGGGTGGAPAAISASRAGAKTLLIEYLHGLGGVGTMGKIARYWHGNRVGFTKEIDAAVGRGSWNIEKKMEWYRKEIVKAGGEIWFQSLACGSVMRGKRVVGIVVATPFGRGAVLANTVIDSTGNAVIAACAELPTMEINSDHISVQGTGLPANIPGGGYFNSDWTFADDDDVVDMWRMFVVGKTKHKDKYDMGQLIDTRARRRIIGDIVITPMDIVNKRKFPDTVTVAKSNFDNHGFSTHTLFMVTPPHMKSLTGHIPYRALMPKGSDGLLTTGLGISAHGDAMPVLRMQPDVQNQGYAAGKAAAMAASENTTVRCIDVKKLQKHLVDIGILDQARLSDKDSYPISLEDMNKAVKTIGVDYQGISKVLVHPDRALPLLKRAYKSSSSQEEKLRYAHVMGMLNDNTGSQILIDKIKSSQWDKGWRFRGMGQFGRTTSCMDNLIIALARTGDKNGIPVVVEKLKQLTAESELSHCRAVAIFFETHRDPVAAKPIAELLSLPSMTGHAFVEIKDEIKRTPLGTKQNGSDNSTRRSSLRELILARALYRCGDYNGLGENILKNYADDLRGHYAAHARAILKEVKK